MCLTRIYSLEIQKRPSLTTVVEITFDKFNKTL